MHFVNRIVSGLTEQISVQWLVSLKYTRPKFGTAAYILQPLYCQIITTGKMFLSGEIPLVRNMGAIRVD